MKEVDYSLLRESYSDFRKSIYSWENYFLKLALLSDCIKKEYKEDSLLVDLMSKAERELSFNGFNITQQNVLGLLVSIHSRINWTEEDEKEIETGLLEKRRELKEKFPDIKF